MNLKFSIERSSRQTLAGKPAGEPGSMRCASAAPPMPVRFADYLGELGFTAIKKQKVQEAPRQRTGTPLAPGGLLKRALSWLNGNYSTPKRLRVLETVTLGDKRLVAVIQAEGRRFLVGGGPSGVSLLTALDHAQRPLDDFESPGITGLVG